MYVWILMVLFTVEGGAIGVSPVTEHSSSRDCYIQSNQMNNDPQYPDDAYYFCQKVLRL